MRFSLTNAARKLCVIGDPVLHSRSPLIQNAMISALGLDYIYLCQRVPRGETAAFLAAARTLDYAGFNATMPHKEALLPLMDELDADAAACGAVNTVCIQDGKLYGHNTDGRGFVRSLVDLGAAPAGRRAVLLGAGGAAKAVALALSAGGAERVFVCNRTEEKAAALCARDSRGVLSPAGFDAETLRFLCSGADLLINCTNLGMAGTAGQFEDFSFLKSLPAHAAVCDLVYSPAETELLRRARLRGLSAANGLGMLLYQAVFALEHFTGLALDAAAMRAAAEAALHSAPGVNSL